MVDKISQLKLEVFKTQAPSRELIVRYFQAIVEEAKKLPVAERDNLASEILQPFVELDSPPEDDSDLEYIVFQLVGGTLDRLLERGITMETSDEQAMSRQLKMNTWQELIERVEQLR